MASADRLLYLDSSALVKHVIREAESEALRKHLRAKTVATSEVAVVEVVRATRVADPSGRAEREARTMLGGLPLIPLDRGLIDRATIVHPRLLRALDAVHLATALSIAADELVAYDQRLLDAAAEAGLATSSPGAAR